MRDWMPVERIFSSLEHGAREMKGQMLLQSAP
jgi:hypothetical protein